MDRTKLLEALNEAAAEFDTADITSFIDDLYALRQKGLANEGEYSIENLIFKEVRNRGWLDELKDLRLALESTQLSLEEATRLAKPRKRCSRKCMTEAKTQRMLTDKERYEARIKISHIIHTQPVIQSNGLFQIYNIKESDLSNILMKLRNLDFIDQHQLSYSSGKYDFSHFNGTGTPAKVYNITGKIVITDEE